MSPAERTVLSRTLCGPRTRAHISRPYRQQQTARDQQVTVWSRRGIQPALPLDMVRAAVLACVLVLLCSATSFAADTDRADAPVPSATSASNAADGTALQPVWARDSVEKRPVALSALYGSYAALQVLDVVSTRRALSRGAYEGNPVVGAAGNARALIVKAAGASASIYFAERMWKKNRVGAIVTMALVNGISTAVVAHNARLARR
jgi:hypothetical protein